MAVPLSRRLLVPTKTDVAAGDHRKLSRRHTGAFEELRESRLVPQRFCVGMFVHESLDL